MNWYQVVRRGTDPIKDTERLARHLDWTREQHEHGTVRISGPSSDLTMGLFVVGAHSRDEATSVATDDPLYQADKTTVDVIESRVHQVLGIGLFDIASLRGTYPDAI